MSSEDLLSSSSLSSEYTNTVDPSVDFGKLVPLNCDMTMFYDSAGETNGEEFMYCKKCQEAHARGEITRVMKIKNKTENLRKHLKNCKFFCADNGLDVVSKASRPKQPSVAKKNDEESVQPVKFTEPPEGCKTIVVKHSRKTETVDITPGTTGAQIVKDLKVIFGIDDDAKCYLRRESDKKVLLGHVDVCKVVSNGDVYRVDFIK